MQTLHQLFVAQLKDLYDAEKRITKALPRMAKAAQAPELRKAFEAHLAETEKQIIRLEQVFASVNEKAKAKKCMAIVGLLEEGKEILKAKGDPAVKDAGLIAAAQKVEHYEIASYGTVRTWAELMGHDKAAKLLQETLNEEGKTDEKLNAVAVKLNIKAEES